MCGLDPDQIRSHLDDIRSWASEVAEARAYVETERLVLRQFDESLLAARSEVSRAKLSPEEVVGWAQLCRLQPPQALIDAMGDFAQPVFSDTWPWGNYETEELRQLAATAEKWWKNYDPSEPDTAPTKQEVTRWLKGRGVEGRAADRIDTILRAKDLPKGPRRPK